MKKILNLFSDKQRNEAKIDFTSKADSDWDEASRASPPFYIRGKRRSCRCELETDESDSDSRTGDL